MRIIDKPTIEFIYPKERADWVTAGKYIELAARNCYKSEEKINDNSWMRMVTLLKSKSHGAMLEFGSVMIRIIGSRGMTHELVRHRMASYAQESTRYCNYHKDKFDNEITVINPFLEDGCSESYRVWYDYCQNAENAYFDLIQLGYKPDVARSVLPTCLKAEIIMKCNFRELLHIIAIRSTKEAHPEIRYIANLIKEECKQKMPEIFS